MDGVTSSDTFPTHGRLGSCALGSRLGVVVVLKVSSVLAALVYRKAGLGALSEGVGALSEGVGAPLGALSERVGAPLGALSEGVGALSEGVGALSEGVGAGT